MKQAITAFLLLCTLSIFGQNNAAAFDDELQGLLNEVDRELERADGYSDAKSRRIDELRQALGATVHDEHRYWLSRSLYNEFSYFDSDSAMAYVDRCSELAQRLGRKDWQNESELNRSYVYSATGLLDDAVDAIEKVDPSTLDHKQTIQYCERMLFIGTRKYQYINDERATTAYPVEIDSLIQKASVSLTPDEPEYGWFIGWANLKDSLSAARVIPELKTIVDPASMETRADAMNAWVLSKLYEYTGDPASRLKYLLRSALADIRTANKEIASLEEAASILFQMGDVEHAREYIDYSIKCANEYKSRIRLNHLSMQKELLLKALDVRDEMNAEQSRRYIIGLSCILLILVLAIVYIGRQMRQLSRSRAALHEANENLRQHVEKLQQTRTELAEANVELSRLYDSTKASARELAAINEAKEKYIANIFGLCSSYINKLDDFRKNIFHMIVARRFDDVSRLTKSPDLPQNEVKELYANFDRIFLQIYPDFVTDFNALLRPEERISLKHGESLNTELRIYALVRLGLDDSVKIAQFLHISVQTVYNTRLKTRNKAIVPKEQFADTVRSLGKPDF